MKRLPEQMVQLVTMVIFVLIVFAIGIIDDRTTAVRVIIFLVILGMILMVNQLYGEIETGPRKRSPETEDLLYSEFLEHNVLLKYSPVARNEAVVVRIIEYIMERAPLSLVSSLPGSEEFLQRFTDEIEAGRMRLVEVSTSGERALVGNPMRLTLDDLSGVEQILSDQAKGEMMVLESLSDIIETLGFERSYKLVKGWLETGSEAGVRLLGVIDPAVHQKREVSSLEGLFQKSALVRGGRLRWTK